MLVGVAHLDLDIVAGGREPWVLFAVEVVSQSLTASPRQECKDAALSFGVIHIVAMYEHPLVYRLKCVVGMLNYIVGVAGDWKQHVVDEVDVGDRGAPGLL